MNLSPIHTLLLISFTAFTFVNKKTEQVTLPYQSSQHGFLFKEVKAHTLSSADLQLTDSLFIDTLTRYNDQQEKLLNQKRQKYCNLQVDYERTMLFPEKYHRQYIAVANKEGEVIVYINCIKKDAPFPKNFHKELVQVLDGGNKYIQLYIHLTKKKVTELYINGEA